MEAIRKNAVFAMLVAFFLGFGVGLFLFGWWLTPVQYIGAFPADLTESWQQFYARQVADLYSHDNNQDRVRAALSSWPEANRVICAMSRQTTDGGERLRLEAVAAINSLDGQGCLAVNEGVPVGAEQESTGPNVVLMCIAALVLIAIFGGLVWVIVQRSRGGGDGIREYGGTVTSDDTLLEEPAGEETTRAIARFRTTFSRGNDSYDDSFPIENADGDFLGECGVGISESIGTDTPRNVTAFEVWLFDKNDIRTITKVIMSDHAFFDDGIKAKLSPKGEAVLGRLNEVVALETASLIINAEIVEMEYGVDNTLPPESYFERFTIELSAWTKENGAVAGETSRGADTALEF